MIIIIIVKVLLTKHCKKKIFLFVTHTIIRSTTSSEICALHLTHPSAHIHLEKWAANAAAPGEQLEVRCLAQWSHRRHGQFLPEPRFEPTTSGYKSDALSIRPRLTLEQEINTLELKCPRLPNIPDYLNSPVASSYRMMTFPPFICQLINANQLKKSGAGPSGVLLLLISVN